MTPFLALGQRALREAWRTPEQLFPTVFIPVFFLVVNVGQAGRIFPSGATGFLEGQNYAAFQVPAALLLAASFGAAAQFLVEEIESGYFDKGGLHRRRAVPSCWAACWPRASRASPSRR